MPFRFANVKSNRGEMILFRFDAIVTKRKEIVNVDLNFRMAACYDLTAYSNFND